MTEIRQLTEETKTTHERYIIINDNGILYSGWIKRDENTEIVS